MREAEQTALTNLQLKYDELNQLVATFSETFFELDKEEAKRRFEECLFWFFVDGYSSGILMLDVDDLVLPNGYEFLDIRYPDGETVLEKFDKYFDEKDAEHMTVLTDSEAHRMYNTGGKMAADDAVEKHGGTVMKRWNTMQDDRVRDMHWMLEGNTIPYEEDFVTEDGDYGWGPGLFQTAENNANCRCWLTYERRDE